MDKKKLDQNRRNQISKPRTLRQFFPMTSKFWQMMSFYRFNGFFGGDKNNLGAKGILWG